MTNKLPSHICTDCADKLRKERDISTENYGFTLHLASCPLCEKEGSLATPADFGLELIINWD